MVQISLKILINKEELEQDNINEKNIKIVINDSDKILDNTNLIKINNKNLIIKTEELKKELKNINKNVEKNDKKVKLIGSPKINKENVINKNVITKNLKHLPKIKKIIMIILIKILNILKLLKIK